MQVQRPVLRVASARADLVCPLLIGELGVGGGAAHIILALLVHLDLLASRGAPLVQRVAGDAHVWALQS